MYGFQPGLRILIKPESDFWLIFCLEICKKEMRTRIAATLPCPLRYKVYSKKTEIYNVLLYFSGSDFPAARERRIHVDPDSNTYVINSVKVCHKKFLFTSPVIIIQC